MNRQQLHVHHKPWAPPRADRGLCLI